MVRTVHQDARIITRLDKEVKNLQDKIVKIFSGMAQMEIDYRKQIKSLEEAVAHRDRVLLVHGIEIEQETPMKMTAR